MQQSHLPTRDRLYITVLLQATIRFSIPIFFFLLLATEKIVRLVDVAYREDTGRLQGLHLMNLQDAYYLKKNTAQKGLLFVTWVEVSVLSASSVHIKELLCGNVQKHFYTTKN